MAPRPDAATPAPPRFLPDFDNVLLGFADRSRMMSAEDSKRLVASTRSFRAVLVDGTVAGGWAIETKKDAARLVVAPFRKLRKADVRAVEAEGTAFLRFMEEGAARFGVEVLAVE